MSLKHPTLRKLANRGLTPIRYHTPPPHSEARHGWIVSHLPRGGMIIQLVGADRPKRLTIAETRYVKPL